MNACDVWSKKCLDCILPKSLEEKQMCGLHWRPGSGTKVGFPVDGWECPKDTLIKIQAIKERRTVSDILNELIAEYLEKKSEG